MSTYVMSDLHGNYKAYMAMLEKIQFSDDDMLYILGDILDRGPNPIKIILDLMERPNVVVLAGNHCLMACECFKVLLQEITTENLHLMNENMIMKLLTWQRNGSKTTTDEFHKCSKALQREIVEFIADFELYEELEINGKTFILVHAGFENFSPDRALWDYDIEELVWVRPDYSVPYFKDKYVITGHTPTIYIEENPRPGYIYHANNHIVIDCGCNAPQGHLGCLRLEDMKEFYVKGR